MELWLTVKVVASQQHRFSATANVHGAVMTATSGIVGRRLRKGL
jgi:hypothetical protein